MRTQQRVFLRGETYYYRRRVPQDLLHIYNKALIVFSLNTKDKKEAEPLGRIQDVKFDQEFEAHRKSLSSPGVTEITTTEAKRLALLWSIDVLKTDEEDRLNGFLGNLYDSYKEGLEVAWDDWTDRLRYEYAKGKPLSAFSPMDSFLAEVLPNHKIKPGTSEYSLLALEFLEAGVKAIELIRQRNNGERVETPASPPPVATSAPVVVPVVEGTIMLSKAVDRFLSNQDSSKPMYDKYKATMALFMEWVGDKPLSSLRQMDIEDFCKGICRLPPRWLDICKAKGISPKDLAEEDHDKVIAPKTFKGTYMAALRPFIIDSKRIFADDGISQVLTTDRIKYSGDREEGENKQRPIKPQELKRMFEGPEYKDMAASPAQAYKYWLPLIGLYTGARVNEVCQINPQVDVIQDDETGIWYLNISEHTEAAEGVKKSVKNKESNRKVPIHSKLIELGFLEYAQALKDQGAKALFNGFKPSAAGKASGEAEKWFRIFIKELGLRDETPGERLVGFHAFRSTIDNYALNHGFNLDHIVGHSTNTSKVVRGYQHKLWLTTAKEIIEKVQFDVDPPCPNP